jgi:hypothetical protein
MITIETTRDEDGALVMVFIDEEGNHVGDLRVVNDDYPEIELSSVTGSIEISEG